MSDYSAKRLGDVKSEFERGVFLALYHSRKQKMHRRVAILMLIVKHSLRGFLFSWPLYLIALAALVLPGLYSLLFVLLLIPAVYLSWNILRCGVREDYGEQIQGCLLNPGYAPRILLQSRRK